jgi:hypothetical protein
MGRGEVFIGAHASPDGFLAARIDEDQCRAGECFRASDESRFNTFAAEVLDRCVAAIVVADATDDGGSRAEPSGGNGLICAFTAGSLKEFRHDAGLACFGDAFAAQNEIGINPANYDDVETGLRHGPIM